MKKSKKVPPRCSRLHRGALLEVQKTPSSTRPPSSGRGPAKAGWRSCQEWPAAKFQPKRPGDLAAEARRGQPGHQVAHRQAGAEQEILRQVPPHQCKAYLNYDELKLAQFGFFKIISIFQLHTKTSTWRSGQRRRNPFWTARTSAESVLSALLRFQTSLLVSLIFHPILFSCLWFCPPVLRFPLLSWISPSFLCTPPISLIPHFLHFLSDFWLEQPTPKSFQIPIEVSTKTAFVSEFKFQHHLCQPATKRTQNNGFMLLKSKILSSVQFVEEIKIIFSWLSRFDERLEIKVCSKSEI